MLKVEKSIVINAPVEEVYAFANDPARLPEYSVGTDEVKDVQRLPNGGYRYTTVDKFVGVRSETVNEDIEVVPNERTVTKMHSALLDATSDTRFERLEGGKTRVSVVGELTFPGGPLARLGETFIGKYCDHGMEMTLEAAKAHIEAAIPTVASR